MNYINCHTWVWGSDSRVVTKVSKLATNYYIKFELDNSSVDFTLDREAMADLRDKLNEILLAEEPNA
jgi:hypothetical protein